MPEGDAVRRTALQLDTALKGTELVVADVRVPRYATVDLRGFTVLGTATVGKHLLTRLGRGGRELTLHTHLRMDGRWVVGDAGPRPCAGPVHQVRVWLAGRRSQAVGLRLAEVAVVATGRESRLVGHLGPDILADDFDPVGAAQRIVASGERGLAEALLDQRVVAGLGTMWASELAHRCGADPRAAAQRCDRDALAAALEEIRSRMTAAVRDGPRRSRGNLAVFERAGQPCRTCAGVIRTARVGRAPTDRITYWCAGCQPG